MFKILHIPTVKFLRNYFFDTSLEKDEFDDLSFFYYYFDMEAEPEKIPLLLESPECVYLYKIDSMFYSHYKDFLYNKYIASGIVIDVNDAITINAFLIMETDDTNGEADSI